MATFTSNWSVCSFSDCLVASGFKLTMCSALSNDLWAWMPAEMSEPLQCECVSAPETQLGRESCELPRSAPAAPGAEVGPCRDKKRWGSKPGIAFDFWCIPLVQSWKFKCLMNQRITSERVFFVVVFWNRSFLLSMVLQNHAFPKTAVVFIRCFFTSKCFEGALS